MTHQPQLVDSRDMETMTMMTIDENNTTDAEHETVDDDARGGRKQDDGDDVGGHGDGENEGLDEGAGDVHHGEIVPADVADRALMINGGDDSRDAFYATLDADVAAELRVAAEGAKTKMMGATISALEAGRILNNAQEILKHGSFGKWLSLEFGKTDRTARNLMSLATVADTALNLFGPEAENKILRLPVTVAYAVGADNVPDQAKTEIIERIVSDELDDNHDIMEAVKEAKAVERQRREAEEEASGKRKKAGDEGEGEETFAEKKAKYEEANRRYSAFLLAVGLVVSEEDGGTDAASDVTSRYSEILKGLKADKKAACHVMISETILNVAKAYEKGMDAVNKLKPAVPDAPVAKAKKAKKTDEGDD